LAVWVTLQEVIPMGRTSLVRDVGSAILTGLVVATIVTTATAADESAIRFDRDIRPILAENCYACHGPGTQEAGLRLDSHEAATAELDSGGRAIVAGDEKASEVLARVIAHRPRCRDAATAYEQIPLGGATGAAHAVDRRRSAV
jgi:hypothetical protein